MLGLGLGNMFYVCRHIPNDYSQKILEMDFYVNNFFDKAIFLEPFSPYKITGATIKKDRINYVIPTNSTKNTTAVR